MTCSVPSANRDLSSLQPPASSLQPPAFRHHLGLWCGPRDSPHLPSNRVDTSYYEPYDDGPMPDYENVLTD
jgi:hypothetical protein